MASRLALVNGTDLLLLTDGVSHLLLNGQVPTTAATASVSVSDPVGVTATTAPAGASVSVLKPADATTRVREG